MDKLTGALLILLTIHSCSSFIIPFVCPPHTRQNCPNIPSSCKGCGGSCTMGGPQFEVTCSSANLPILQQNSFSSLQTVNRAIHLYLGSSHITSIDDDAFSGIENKIEKLDLTGNSLVSILAAVGKLPNLKDLLLSGNPIRTVSDSDIAGISKSLAKLTISLDHMLAYPPALDKLSAWDLTLDDVPFDLADPTIFQGNRAIKILMLTYSSNYNGRYLIPPCIVNLPSLLSVYTYGRQIPCDCSLAYLKHWDVTNVRILSPCTDGIYHAREYIQGYLQHC